MLTETCHFFWDLKKLMGVYNISSYLIGQTDTVTTIPGLPFSLKTAMKTVLVNNPVNKGKIKKTICFALSFQVNQKKFLHDSDLQSHFQVVAAMATGKT